MKQARRRVECDLGPEFPSFRFSEADGHVYTDRETGEEIPSITTLLSRAGLVKGERWYTAASADRGHHIHALLARYDLGALAIESCESEYKGWLLGHAKAMAMLQPEWEHIEVPMVHARPRFAGRCDRIGKIHGAWSVFEVKSGKPDRSHAIQLALQAILVAPVLRLPPEGIMRYAEYLRENGKASIEQHLDRRDFDTARDILARFCD